jgi:hypothetical protein
MHRTLIYVEGLIGAAGSSVSKHCDPSIEPAILRLELTYTAVFRSMPCHGQVDTTLESATSSY